MIAMAAVLLYNIVELTRKYLDYPISVTFSVDHQQQLTFPTVAICNMSPVKKSSLEAAQNVKRRKKRSAGMYTLIAKGPCTILAVSNEFDFSYKYLRWQ